MSSEAWTVLGTVLTGIGLVVAAVQTVRYRVASALLKKINEREQIANWALYDMIVQAYDALAEVRSSLRSTPNPKVEEVEAAAKASSLLNAMWLRAIEHAALLEDQFDEGTIDLWTQRGRLDSDWRRQRATKLLPSATSEAAVAVAPATA